MARGQPPVVPPELAEIYSGLLVCAKVRGSTERVVRLAPEVRAARPARPQAPDLALASSVAAWLTRRHAGGLCETARRAFYAARRAELLARTFPPAYWHTAAPTRDECELCYPAYCTPGPSAPPAYDDPERRPSTCSYSTINRRYPVPEGPGTASDPAPGWRGEVVQGHFVDLRHVQRALLFTLPEPVTAADDRPLLAHVRMHIHAAASHRGNRAWFAPGTVARIEGSTARWNQVWTRWSLSRPFRYAIPPEAPGGWSHSLEQTGLVDLRRLTRGPSRWSGTRVHLKQISAPAKGRYFAGNDWVEVWWSGTLAVYLARLADG
jgi:hypothetical protein